MSAPIQPRRPGQLGVVALIVTCVSVAGMYGFWALDFMRGWDFTTGRPFKVIGNVLLATTVAGTALGLMALITARGRGTGLAALITGVVALLPVIIVLGVLHLLVTTIPG
ncbi:MAG TPA: hypothetical protein IAA98_07225 [Candidatus Avipropionibacterium avicola]|uniref:Uncharacterized protein n=1 Tax=Candidatus Avipropionibacterium avicola TaxID=2840701 RepID=A0A9D1GXS0_9ACTN|nr:hypothetical protein [Candidatus Avipropionibacterium avicola]